MIFLAASAEKYSPELLTRAQNGNADAQFWVGYAYYKGEGVTKDVNEALDMGSINALATLAVLSYNSEGVPQDYNRAFKLLKRCTTHRRNITDNVYVEIARDLSACYRYGRGTTVDKELANYWMVISELNGNKAVADVRSLFTVSSKII